MTEEQWALALINNSSDLWVEEFPLLDSKPFWAEGVEGSWDQFWKTTPGLKILGTYFEPNYGQPDYTEYAPNQWRFWANFGDGRIDPQEKKKIGLAYLEHLYGEDMMRFIDVDNIDPAYINLLNYTRNTMNPQLWKLFADSSDVPFQVGEIPPEGTVYLAPGTFDTLVRNPMLLNLVNSSFANEGDFADLALQYDNISQLGQQSPMFNMILQTMLDTEGNMKNLLIGDIFATEDSEGNYLFDQAVERAMFRAMGVDPDQETTVVTGGYEEGGWTVDQQPIGELLPHPIEQVSGDIESLKDELTALREEVKSMRLQVITAMKNASEARSFATRALSQAGNCSCTPANPAEADSDAGTPDFAKGEIG